MKIDIHNEIFKMNADELESIMASVKLRRNQLHFKSAHSLRVGQRVSFQGRHGITEKGTVEKIKIKYVVLYFVCIKGGLISEGIFCLGIVIVHIF